MKISKTGRAALAGVMCLAAGVVAGSGATAQAAPAAPDVRPPVRSTTTEGAEVRLDQEVTIVAAADVDQPALRDLREIIAAAGGTAVIATEAPEEGVVVHLGTGLDDALASLGLTPNDDPEGYVLGTGLVEDRPTVVLSGADARGTYYAVQSLRQVVADGAVPALQIEDHPQMPIRGTIEGFYGIPWSHEARLDLLEFSGERKLNTYIYTPKDDLLLRHEWRELYEGEDLERISELVEQANQHHVDFTFALSPANDLCYSSEEDFQATVAKFEQLRELGVDSFYVALDDIPLSFHCDADREKYPDNGDWAWLADAQTDYLNRLQDEWIEPNGLQDLQTVPTNYNGSEEDPYKGRFGDRLDEDIRVQWTGEGVFSDTVTVESVQRATQSYRTDHLYIWDNFPVNDGRRDRLFLKPVTGRDADLHQYIDGFTSNPMIQPYASWPALANYADYTWNAPAYDPEESMDAVLDDLAGPDPAVRESLRAFVDLNQSWPYPVDRPGNEYAPELNADMARFWDALESGDTAGTEALKNRLGMIRQMPTALATMAEQGFFADSEPWIVLAQQWADVLGSEIDMLEALDAGQGDPAAAAFIESRDLLRLTKQPTVDDQDGDGVYHEDAIVPTTGDGRFDEFDAQALEAFADWLGVQPTEPVPGFPATASSSMGTYQDHDVALATDDDPATYYWSNEKADEGDFVQVDLGQEREVGRVEVRQGSADHDGDSDMIQDATLQYSVDGENWTDLGDYQSANFVLAELDEPVNARYVRLVANSANAGGQWVKVRDFTVSDAKKVNDGNLPATEGHTVAQAFDGGLATSYEAASAPVDGSFIARYFEEPRDVTALSVVGTASGAIEVQVGDEWRRVGDLREGGSLHEAAVGEEITGVRLSFEAGSAAPRIFEVVAETPEVCSLTLSTAGQRLVGTETNAWGTADECDGPVTVQAKQGDGWQSIGEATPDEDGFFVVPLDEVDTRGTHTLRAVEGDTASEETTLQRVARTSRNSAAVATVGIGSNVWGTVDGEARVSTQVFVPGHGWSTSQVRDVTGGYTIPLTYGQHSAGTLRWRLVVEHSFGEREITGEFVQRRVPGVTATSAGQAPVGRTASVWGSTAGGGQRVWTEVRLPDGTWTRSQLATSGADGGYVLELTYGKHTVGTYRWRVATEQPGVGVVRSEEFTFVRR